MLILLGRTWFLFHHLRDSSQLHQVYANYAVEIFFLLKLHPFSPQPYNMINLHFEPTLNTE